MAFESNPFVRDLWMLADKTREINAQNRKQGIENQQLQAMARLQETAPQQFAAAGVDPNLANLAGQGMAAGNFDAYRLALESQFNKKPGPAPIGAEMGRNILSPLGMGDEASIKAVEGLPMEDAQFLIKQMQEQRLQNQKLAAEKRKEQAAKPTMAQSAADRAFGKTYNDYILEGGYADVERGIKQIDDVIARLKKNSSLTGPTVGIVPKGIRDITDPESASAQEMVEEIVQRSLRPILGAAFGAEEGERLIKRAYNPTLSAEENIDRLSRLSKQVKEAHGAKMRASQFYEQTGSMQNFPGTIQTETPDFLKPDKKIGTKKIPLTDETPITEVVSLITDPAVKAQAEEALRAFEGKAVHPEVIRRIRETVRNQ